MTLGAKLFELVRVEQKTVELRVNDEKRRLVKVGDTIIFTNQEDKDATVEVLVIGLKHAPSFYELLNAIDLHLCGYPENTTHAEAVEAVRRYYSEAEEREYGVVAIEIKALK